MYSALGEVDDIKYIFDVVHNPLYNRNYDSVRPEHWLVTVVTDKVLRGIVSQCMFHTCTPPETVNMIPHQPDTQNSNFMNISSQLYHGYDALTTEEVVFKHVHETRKNMIFNKNLFIDL